MFTPARRRYIYRVATAALPLLVFYGLVADQAAPLWAALIGSATVSGLAAHNTPRDTT